MPGYVLIPYRRYHDTFVAEFFLQLANVIEVSRGRIPRQQRFKEQASSLLCSLVQNFGGTIGGAVGSIGGVGVSFLGEREEGKKVTLLTSEHLSGQWHSLREMVNTAATGAVGRYRDYLSKCNEEDATELGRISAQRLWEYLARTGRPFSIDDMLTGILKGKSGFLRDGLFNTKLSQGKDTAEGALKHSGIAYCDENRAWRYTSHPDGKERYGFMLLPHAQAIVRITEKRHRYISLSEERSIELQALLEGALEGDITQDSTLIDEDELRLKKLEQDWCDIGAWQEMVDEKLAKTEGAIAVVEDICVTHSNRLAVIDIDIVETKDRVGDIESTLPEIQERAYMHGQTLRRHGDRLDGQHEHLFKLQRNVLDIAESRRFTYIPKPYFQPRIGLWTALERRLSIEGPNLPVALVGLGGVGKTSIAMEWTNKQKKSGKYHSIRRLLMDKENIESSLYDLAHDLYIETDKRERNDWLGDVAQRFQMQSWLMIWDNVGNYSEIKEVLPYFTSTTPTQQLIITSRDTTSWQDLILVDNYMLEESIAYIQHQMTAAGSPWFKREHAEKLAEYLGHHPLALELAMGTVCLYQRPLEQYLKELEEAGLSTLKAPDKKLNSQARINTNRLATLWQIGLTNLPGDAIKLLRLMSFISAEGIERSLIVDHFENNEDRSDEALLALRQHSFIQPRADLVIETWKMHRLLQEVIRNDWIQMLSNKQIDLERFLSETWYVVGRGITVRATAVDVHAITQGVAHGNALWINLKTIMTTWPKDLKNHLLPLKANLLSKVGYGEHRLFRFSNAKEHLESALTAHREIHRECTAHLNIAGVLHSLGNLFQSQGNDSQAIAYYDSALAMYYVIYGEHFSHQDIATNLHNLGGSYQSKGDFQRAITYSDSSLAMYYAIYGENANHVEIAAVLNKLGQLYYEFKSDFRQAIAYYDTSLAMYYALYGENTNHVEIAAILNCLGGVYGAQDDYQCAITYFEKSLSMYHAIYSETFNHPDIAHALNNLGVAYKAKGDYSKAITYYDASLIMYRTIYGESINHPEIANILSNLGNLYKSKGDYPKAITYHNSSLKMHYAIYGEDTNHPGIADILSSLGQIYRLQADFQRAITYLESALTMNRFIYGEHANHPSIASILDNLGMFYVLQDDHIHAITYFNASLAMYHAIYGEDTNHIDVADALKNLGSAYQAQGEYQRAIDYYKSSLTMHRAVYGETSNHPGIAYNLGVLGTVYISQHDYTQAITNLEASLSMYRTIYGSSTNHPEIAKTLGYLGGAFFRINPAKAIVYNESSLAMNRIIYGEKTNHPSIASILKNQGLLYICQDSYSQAITYLNASLAMNRAIYGENSDHSEITSILKNIALTRQLQDITPHTNTVDTLEAAIRRTMLDAVIEERRNLSSTNSDEEIECSATDCFVGTICCPCVVVVSALQCCGFFSKSSDDASHQTLSSEKYGTSSNPLTTPLVMER